MNMETESKPIKSVDNRNPDGTFGANNNANPNGRPKGQTLKEWVRTKLIGMTDVEREDFLKDVSKDIQWKMAEGNPETKSDVTVKDETSKLSPEALEVAKKYEEELNKLEDGK